MCRNFLLRSFCAAQKGHNQTLRSEPAISALCHLCMDMETCRVVFTKHNCTHWGSPFLRTPKEVSKFIPVDSWEQVTKTPEISLLHGQGILWRRKTASEKKGLRRTVRGLFFVWGRRTVSKSHGHSRCNSTDKWQKHLCVCNPWKQTRAPICNFMHIISYFRQPPPPQQSIEADDLSTCKYEIKHYPRTNRFVWAPWNHVTDKLSTDNINCLYHRSWPARNCHLSKNTPFKLFFCTKCYINIATPEIKVGGEKNKTTRHCYTARSFEFLGGM